MNLFSIFFIVLFLTEYSIYCQVIDGDVVDYIEQHNYMVRKRKFFIHFFLLFALVLFFFGKPKRSDYSTIKIPIGIIITGNYYFNS